MLRSGVSSSGIMIDQASKDTDKMLGNDEVPSGYLKDNDSHLHSQEGGNVSHQKPESKGQTLPVYDYVKANNSMIWEPCAVPNVGYSGPFYRPDGYPLPFAHHDIVRQQLQFNPFENNVYARNPDYLFPIEKGFSCFPPVKMLSQAQPHQFQTQEFQYFVVIDFEATCDKEKIPDPQEIIEFPSVLVNSSTGQLEAFFQTYVRPAYHQHLTDFCKELTGIQQIQVDRGVSLSEALQMHDKWLEKKGIKHKNFVVVTWSNWDCRVMLESECRFKRIRKPSYFNRWINLKVPFQNIFQGVRCNLKEAVQHAGLTWEGRAHCGLDDARNTARLLVHLMDKGVKFCVTNSLISQSREFPMNSEPFSLSDHNQRNPKPREMIGAFAEFHPFMGPYGKEKQTYCFCGVLSSKCIVRKPGPAQGRYFFGCGNWTAARRAACNYFVWASP